jgi:hypothetical protein
MLYHFITVATGLPKAQEPQKILDSLKAAGYNVGSAGTKHNSATRADTNRLNDAVFEIKVSGQVNESINFIQKGGIPNQSYIVSASYSAMLGLLRVNIAGNQQLSIGFGVIMPENKPGTYKMNEASNKLDIGGYANPQLNKNSFVSTAGTLTITKGQIQSTYTGSKDWCIDGHFEMMLENSSKSEKIKITGSFRNAAVKLN